MKVTMIKNNEVINLPHQTFKLLRFDVQPPVISNQFETMDYGGMIDLQDTEMESRKIEMEFLVYATDYQDSLLAKNQVSQLFISKDAYYLINQHEEGKRWKVKLDTLDIKRVNATVFNVIAVYFCVPVYAESVGTTLNPLTFDEEIWQTGQGLILENPEYAHQSNTFRIYNAGDVPVDPRRMGLLIKFVGNATNLQIKNTTTGDTWQHTGTLTKTDTLLLDGIKSLKNGQSIFKNTNKKLITIAPGWNDFQITGASDFLITFDFRFYYY